MTRVQAAEMVRALLGARDTSGVWTAATLNTLVNFAQRDVWRRLVAQHRQLCIVEEHKAYRAGYASEQLYVVAGGGMTTFPVEAIIGCFTTQYDAAVSATNPCWAMVNTNVSDIDRWSDNTLHSLDSGGTYRYALLGNNTLMVRPIPSGALPVVIRYVPTPADLDTDAKQIFGGLLFPAHDLVVRQMCILATMRTREDNRAFREEFREAWQAYAMTAATNPQFAEAPRNALSD